MEDYLKAEKRFDTFSFHLSHLNRARFIMASQHFLFIFISFFPLNLPLNNAIVTDPRRGTGRKEGSCCLLNVCSFLSVRHGWGFERD